MPFEKYLSRQFSITYDIYLAVRAAVRDRIKAALHRDDPTWALRHNCPPCMYKLEGEAKLIFDILWAKDGNDSLKRWERRAAADSSNPELGPSVESIDTRVVEGDLYIPRSDVNKWAHNAESQPSQTVEVCSLRPFACPFLIR